MWPTKMFSGCGTSYPREKEKSLFIIIIHVPLFRHISQKIRVEKKKIDRRRLSARDYRDRTDQDYKDS